LHYELTRRISFDGSGDVPVIRRRVDGDSGRENVGDSDIQVGRITLHQSNRVDGSRGIRIGSIDSPINE
jgi:hypothetical protein